MINPLITCLFTAEPCLFDQSVFICMKLHLSCADEKNGLQLGISPLQFLPASFLDSNFFLHSLPLIVDLLEKFDCVITIGHGYHLSCPVVGHCVDFQIFLNLLQNVKSIVQGFLAGSLLNLWRYHLNKLIIFLLWSSIYFKNSGKKSKEINQSRAILLLFFFRKLQRICCLHMGCEHST